MRVPDVVPARTNLPPVTEHRLGTGLTVVTVRRRTPVAEIRLRVPLGPVDPAAAMVLSTPLLAGTDTARLRRAGAELIGAADVDRLLISGSCPPESLPIVLAELAECLEIGGYAPEPVAAEAAKLAELTRLARGEPAMAADEALNARIYGDHPYGRAPRPEDVLAVTADDLIRLHADRVGPDRAVLVVVGDVDVDPAMFGGWRPRGRQPSLPAAGPLRAGPPEVIHRAGERALIRVATEGASPAHPDGVPLEVAAVLLGGYCSSRLFAGLRERLGIAYTPRAALLHAEASSKLVVSVQVAAGAAGVALREIRYELGRLALEPATVSEVVGAARYALGSRQLATATPAGLADHTVRMAGHGLGPDAMAEREERLLALTPDVLLDAAGRYLNPAGSVSLVVGDAELIDLMDAA